MDERQKITIEVAEKIGVEVDWLARLIAFETARTWDPKVKNMGSSARGLIQFMNSTARNLGYKDSHDLVEKNPTFEKQMNGPVFKYLKQWDYTTAQSLYMAVFYPAYRYAHPDTEFNFAVKVANPGIETVKDYVNKVEKTRLPEWWEIKKGE